VGQPATLAATTNWRYPYRTESGYNAIQHLIASY
jgi:hypothetical protein